MTPQNQLLTDFGTRLKSERKKLGLTQQGLAELAHTKQDYIAQIERGIRNPSLNTLINLLTALNISADELIFGNIENKQNEAKILKKINDFLARKNAKDITAYYEIVKFMAKYIDSNKENNNDVEK
ncbi:MAG: helix-turn-helix domain-containing protein [Defluviitaleaceae bacterium]|nr:helix-turn-helix domain-containing protein [Defluviitaleaceae bacterium]